MYNDQAEALDNSDYFDYEDGHGEYILDEASLNSAVDTLKYSNLINQNKSDRFC